MIPKYPKVAIVGRPNVGKSTLFNAIVGSDVSVEFKEPGTTRDRVEAVVHSKYTLIDTGGYFFGDDELERLIAKQTKIAFDEAYVCIVVFDGKQGLHPADMSLISEIIKSGKPSLFVVNKIDSHKDELFAHAEFSHLNLPMHFVSALHRKNLDELERAIEELVEHEHETGTRAKPIRVAIIGRPNVGKSSLTNVILRQAGLPERLIVHDKPGTTRDAIRVPFEFEGKYLILVDTPGIRRRSRVDRKGVEIKSVDKAIEAAEVSDVCVLVIDSSENVARQDKRLAGLLLRKGKPTVIAFNKIDLVDSIPKTIELGFISWARFVPTSAVKRTGIKQLLRNVIVAEAESRKKLKPTQLEELAKTLRLKLKGQNPKIYQKRVKPPVFELIVNSARQGVVNIAEKTIRDNFGFWGTPVKIDMKER